MHFDKDEEALLRSVALQNARAVLAARERAERESILAREALEKSNRRIGSILESITDGFLALDREGRFTFVNRRAEEMMAPLGRTVVGAKIWDVFPDLVGTAVEENYRRAVQEQATVQFETFYAPLNAWFDIRVYPSTDGVSIYFRDVTERRRAQAALRQSEQRFRAVFSQAAVGIAMAALDGRFLEVNQKFMELFGYSADELKQRTFIDLTHPEDLPITRERVGSLTAGRVREIVYEKRYLRKDGSMFWSCTTVTLLKDAHGKPLTYIGVVEDISTRKQAEDALREESRVLELLNNTGRAIAAQLDLQSVVQTVTDSATELCGAKFGAFFYNVINEQGEALMLYTLSGAARESFEKFGMPRNTPVFNPTFTGKGVVRSGDITRDPRYGRMAPHHGMPKGHLPVRSYLAVPVISRSGAVIGGLFFGHPDTDVFTERAERLVVGVAAQAAIAIDNARLYESAQREIAERKRAEAALRESERKLAEANAELDRKVQERTASLQNAIAQMEEFSYSVSHDLRAPLRAIDAYAGFIQSDFGSELPPGAKVFLEKISRNTARMNRLIHDVLTLSRIARSEVSLQPVPLEPLIAEIIEQHPQMQSPNAEIHVNVEGAVLADDLPLSQAVANLLTNAVKFVAPGVKPIVTISTERRGRQVRLAVQDNGIGIEPELQGKLFGMFQRLTADPGYEGTGVGLAIVKKAVERMGGSVGVQSDGKHGSRFWIDLPAADSTAA